MAALADSDTHRRTRDGGARFRRRLLLLTLAALAARLTFLALEPATRPTGDERTWIGWGIQSPAGVASPEVRFSPLRAGVLFYPPLYPYFIGAVYALFGTLTAVQIGQAALGALLVPAVGRVGARVGGARAGTLAAASVAFYPDLVWFSVHFWSETLFMLLLWWALERLLAADDDGRQRTALAAGILWGLAVLTRETTLYFTPVAALWLALRRRRDPLRRGAPARGAVFLAAALATVAPWTLRNGVVHGAFIPVSTAGGLNLWQGNARLTRQQVYDRYQAVSGLVEQYRHARRMGLAAIAERQPAWLFEKLRDELPPFFEADSLALVHARRGAYGDVSRGATLTAAAVALLPYLGVLALFVIGCARVPFERRVALLLVFLAYYALLHVATHGFARYRLPVMPVLFVIAAAGIAAGRVRVSASRRLAVAALAVALLASVAPSVRAWRRFAAGGSPAQEEGAPPSP
jgi:4-amino-4-deoxy-L-arabinose transferase-like glycosyltransferase